MKNYKIYNYAYDSPVEDSYFFCLTKKHGDHQEEIGGGRCWYIGRSELTIKQIIKNTWDREDLDIFLQENPECEPETFMVYKKYNEYDGKLNYNEYCLLKEKREKAIKELLN
jgi:hypothetical protein